MLKAEVGRRVTPFNPNVDAEGRPIEGVTATFRFTTADGRSLRCVTTAEHLKVLNGRTLRVSDALFEKVARPPRP